MMTTINKPLIMSNTLNNFSLFTAQPLGSESRNAHGERCVTPARAAAKETASTVVLNFIKNQYSPDVLLRTRITTSTMMVPVK